MDGQSGKRRSGGKLGWAATALLLLALALTQAGCWGRAAGQTGRITGQVMDAQTGKLLEAVVTAAGVAYRTVNGVYLTGPLPYGTYRLRAEAPGYYPQEVTVTLSSATQAQVPPFRLTPISDATPPPVKWTFPVAFASNGDDRGGLLQLYLMDPEVPGVATRLSTGGYEDEQPAWSPDGRQLVFVSKRPLTPQLYVTRADAFAPRPLLPGSASSDREPAWSPDGRRIAFASDRPPGEPCSGRPINLYVVDVDPATGTATGAPRQVTRNDPSDPTVAYWDEQPEWAPDVTIGGVSYRGLLVFSSDRGPGGARLLYAVDTEAEYLGKIGEPAGYPVSCLTPSEVDLDATDPAWSPDGTKIVYSSRQDGVRHLWVIDVTVHAGVGYRTVTASNRRRLTADPEDEEQPVWSPRGDYLMFVSNRSGSPDIYRIDVNRPGAAPVLMAAGNGRQTNPAWARQ